jgi:methionine aminotransferase
MLEETLRSRLPHSEGSIFARCSSAAARYQAVNLAQGFPDFGPDPRLIAALQAVAALPQSHQYGPPEGVKSLREAVAAMFADLYGLCIDPDDEVTVTVGATEAIFSAVQALLRPGDEAIFFTPAFECYESAVRLAGATPLCVPLQAGSYRPDWQALRAALTPRTRLVILNTPHNPSGTTWTLQELQALAAMAAEHGFWVLSDEVYHNIVFAPQRHVCVRALPELAARSVVVGSLGKTLHVTGWRLGYAIAPPALTRELRKLHQFVAYAAPTPLQHAVATMLTEPESYRGLAGLIQGKRDRFLQGLEGSRFHWRPSQGGYFQLLDYSAISDETDLSFADRLIKEHRVAAIPLSSFGSCPQASRLLRFCIAKKDETLDLAASILRGI